MPEPAVELPFDYHGRCVLHGRLDCPPCEVAEAATEPPSISDEVYDESRYTPEAREIMDEHDQRRAEPPTINGYTRDELRRYALEEQRLHDPKLQEGNGYNRCEHCHYTRHPCDVYDLATCVLVLLDAGRPDSSWEGHSPVGEYTGLAAEQFLDRHRPR